jgi:flagellar capping protein FliD
MEQFDHKPHHPLVKVKWLLQDREKPMIKLDAMNALDRALALFPLASTEHVAEHIEVDGAVTGGGTHATADPREQCICCSTLVSVPFWICVSCGKPTSVGKFSMLIAPSPPVDIDTLICIDCDTNKRPPLSPDSPHDHSHPLVRYQYPELDVLSEVKTVESKLASLETHMNDRLDRLEKHIAARDIALDERFEHLERKLDAQDAIFNGRFDTMENLLRSFVAGR